MTDCSTVRVDWRDMREHMTDCSTVRMELHYTLAIYQLVPAGMLRTGSAAML